MSHNPIEKEAVQLTPSEVIILQQLYEDGEDDLRSLPSLLGSSRQHITDTIDRLKHKGLVTVDMDIDNLWVHLTAKSKRLIRLLWPESQSYAY